MPSIGGMKQRSLVPDDLVRRSASAGSMETGKSKRLHSPRSTRSRAATVLAAGACLLVLGLLWHMTSSSIPSVDRPQSRPRGRNDVHTIVPNSTATTTTQQPSTTTVAATQTRRAKTAEELTAPLMALPLLCNPRNTRPLTPRPREYDPSKFDVLIGILSLDNDDHAGLRATQRESWFWYRDVAKPSNGFGGRLMVEYYFGAAYENNYTFSDALRRESEEHANILVMDLKEPMRKSKQLLTTGRYGHAAEVTMSIKDLAFYCYAEQTYQRAKFIVKADDDEFIRVPVALRTADALPSYGVLWGGVFSGHFAPKAKQLRFCSTWGVWMGMSRDVLHLINSLWFLQRYGAAELTEDGVRGADGKLTTFHYLHDNTPFIADDAIPGAAVFYFTRVSGMSREVRLDYDIILYREAKCRIHNHQFDTRHESVRYYPNPFSMVIHHANHSQQMHYRSLYPDDATYNMTFTPRRGTPWCGGMIVRHTKTLCEKPEASVFL